jgi:glycerol-3-phosphate dehydrogenase
MRDKREATLARLRSEPWDVLIVGGGINGAGIARDLMLRDAGLKVALVEKEHFASGTSGKNSQLIHGGLRYLKYFDFGLVSDALRERATLLRIAPGLVEPLEFLIPCYGPWDRWFYGAGLLLYDALAGSRSLGRHKALSGADAARLEPRLASDGLRAGLLFFDAKVHSARLVLENIIDAEARGACTVNYTEAKAGADRVVTITDVLGGESFTIRPRKVVDATGAWSSGEISTGAKLRLVRGSHLIYPRIQQGHEAIAHFDEQGRIIFFIPWGENDDLTLVGTTDVDHTDGPDNVHISQEEREYLKAIVRRLFPEFEGEPVTSYSSLRPLIAEGGRSATATSREHRIWETPDKVLHISGGKYTTYREMSEELVDTLLRDLAPGRDLPCRTATSVIPVETPPRATLPRVRMAVEREFARKLRDLLYVSTYWGHERHMERDWLEPIAREMGSLLGWSGDHLRNELETCLREQERP